MYTLKELINKISVRYENKKIELLVSQEGFPMSFSLGNPPKDFTKKKQEYDKIVDWANKHNIDICYMNKRLMGLSITLPVKITINSIDDMAKSIGELNNLNLLRERLEIIDEHYYEKREFLLNKTKDLDDVNFQILINSLDWFSNNKVSGLTPREVPIPGISGKWLNSKTIRDTICTVLDIKDLGLIERGRDIIIKHLDTGKFELFVDLENKVFDYNSDFIIIVENKDTFYSFPNMKNGICIYGAGFSGAKNIPEIIPEIKTCTNVYYWGDMDASGLEILNAYREAGVNCKSILMNITSYNKYKDFGTNLEKTGKTYQVRDRKNLLNLYCDELELYNLLTDINYNGNRMVEQEKIPLIYAVKEIENQLILSLQP